MGGLAGLGASHAEEARGAEDQERSVGRLRRIKWKRIRDLLEAFAEELERAPGLAQKRSDLAMMDNRLRTCR